MSGRRQPDTRNTQTTSLTTSRLRLLTPSGMMKFDEVLTEHIGEFGRYQRGLVVLLCVTGIVTCLFTSDIVLIAGRQEHWCSVEPSDRSNFTHEEWLNLTVPWEFRDGGWRRSRCSRYDLNFSDAQFLEGLQPANLTGVFRNVSRMSCDSYEYDESVFQSTIVSQVCVTFTIQV